jgi:hypothetical protein
VNAGHSKSRPAGECRRVYHLGISAPTTTFFGSELLVRLGPPPELHASGDWDAFGANFSPLSENCQTLISH